MKKAIILFVVSLMYLSGTAQSARKQNNNNLQVGLKVGAGYTEITDLSKILVSESYYTGYSFTNKGQYTFSAGIYLNYKFNESISAFYSEISYSRLGNNSHYSDINELEYDFTLKYDYLNLEFWYKAYLFKGLHLGIGPRIGFNLSPGALYYTSNGEALFGPDIRIQQQMRDVLKGRSNFSIGVGTGYEFTNGLSIDVRYYFGINDVNETEVNNFHFIENRNSSRVVQVTLGYTINYNMNFF